MPKRAVQFCRYIPGCNGSPAWMPVAEAEAHLKRDTEHVNQMIAYSVNSPTDVEFWESKYPRIEYAKN